MQKNFCNLIGNKKRKKKTSEDEFVLSLSFLNGKLLLTYGFCCKGKNKSRKQTKASFFFYFYETKYFR